MLESVPRFRLILYWKRVTVAVISNLRYSEAVCWSVEILNDTVAAELRSLPADMHAKFLRIALLIEQAGLETLREPQVKHLEGKIW